MGGPGSGNRFQFGARRTVESCDVIDVRQRSHGGESLATTSCNFGGVRYWFICSDCSRRVAKLYRVGGRYACRQCHGLAYRSQHENYYDRGLLKAQRIRMKLGGSANMTLPFPPKPKFMRWATYYRLAATDQDRAGQWCAALRVWLESLKHVHGN